MKPIVAIAALALVVLASGCLAPDYKRLIPENKSAHLMIFSPIYGWAVIDTRVAGDTNSAPLPPLEAPPTVPTVIIGK